MSELENLTRQFWNAAVFRRRAPDRDQSFVRKVLGNVAINATGRLHSRAVIILKEIDHDPRTDNGDSRSA